MSISVIAKGMKTYMIFLYYEHIDDDLDTKVQELVKRIKQEGIVIKDGCTIPQNIDCTILVLVESVWKYIEEDRINSEFEKILNDKREKNKIIYISFYKSENFKDVLYIKKRKVLFLMDDYNNLLRSIRIADRLENAKIRITKKIFLAKGVIFGCMSLIVVLFSYVLRQPEIPAPQLEIKWEYLSAYDYNYIIELNNIDVVKKAPDLMQNLIELNKNENVIVGTIVIKNIKEEYPERMRIGLEKIQDGEIFEEEINLKTVAHNDYIMIPLFITEKFPEDFTNNSIPTSISKREIFDAINTRVVYNPVMVKYEKEKFGAWNNEEVIEIEESSDVLSEWEISIRVDVENDKTEITQDVDEKEDLKETNMCIPKIYKSRMVGQ